jgi:archaellin
MKLVWNPAVVSGVTVTEGDFFNQGGKTTIFTTNMGSNWVIIDASCLEQNQTPGGGKYIAKLDFIYNTGSGASPVAIENVTLLYMDGSNEYEVTTVTQNMGGKLKFYLGDFASTTPASEDTGDGLINGTDLFGFSTAYWSSYNTSGTLYKSKYDIGPTTPTRYYFGNPVPDGTIGFEDLAIFTMGYSKTGSGTLPDNQEPVKFSLDKIAKVNGTLKLPVRISGNVNDVRAFSMKIKYGNDMEYTGVEPAGEMLEGVKFLIGKSESNTAYMDGAVLGEYEAGLSREGVIAYVLFNEKTNTNHSANIESAIARNSGNLDLEVQFDGGNNGLGIPKTYSLNQNYPNPFNPVTKIEYAIPNDIKVTIKIYDVLGREVNVLVNEVQTAGYYAINWNASNLSSGIYFYQMKAGNFYAVKKMMLIK